MNTHNIVRLLTVVCFFIAISRVEFRGLNTEQAGAYLCTLEHKPVQQKELPPKKEQFKLYGAIIHKIGSKKRS